MSLNMAETDKLEVKIKAVVTRIGAECKSLSAGIAERKAATEALKAEVGDLTTLTGTQKTSVVAALNEQIAALDALEATVQAQTDIDDTQATTTTTYSSSKIESVVTAAKQAVKDDLLGGAGTAYDTLKELADLITANQSAIDALEALAAGHVKFDAAQTLTDEQKTQARTNIGAASAADVSALETTVGTKASQTDLDAVSAKVTANETAIASKASQADLDALEALIGDVENADFVATFEAALV